MLNGLYFSKCCPRILAVETIPFFHFLWFLVGSLGFWTFLFLPTNNYGLPLSARPSTIFHNSLTKISVFSNDLICSLILFACFASSLSIFRILITILITSLFDVSLCLEYDYLLDSLPVLCLQFWISVSCSPQKHS